MATPFPNTPTASPPLPAETLVLLYDGECGLCQRSVHFVLDRDRPGRFRFAALQSAFARDVLARFGRDSQRPDSIHLLRERRDGTWVLEVKGAAVRRLLGSLGIGWRILALLLWLVPRAVLDRVYDAVARRRMRWFGPADACRVPEPGLAERFLDGGPPGSS